MTGRIRQTLTIPCKVIWDNTNELTVQWKKGGVDEIEMTGRFSKGASDNSLVIEDLEFGDQGRCFSQGIVLSEGRPKTPFSDGHFYLPEFRLLPHFLCCDKAGNSNWQLFIL